MSYCHECGEKIAPDDVFCPYCGIALQRAPVASPSAGGAEAEELQFDATQVDISPVAVPTPFEKPVEAPPAEEVVVKDISLPGMPQEFKSDEPSFDSPPKTKTSEHISLKTEEEIAGLKSYLPTKEESAGETPAEPEESAPPAQIEAEKPDKLKDFEVGIRFDEPDIQSSPAISKGGDFAVEEPSVGEVVGRDSVVEKYLNQEPQPSFDQTVPYVAGYKPEISPETDKQTDDASACQPEAQIKPPATPYQEASEEENLPATLISAPLPPRDEDKIQETPPPVSQNQDFYAGDLSKRVEKDFSETPAAYSASQPTPDRGVRESRSYTTPNVNSVDTGGKKAKLKTLSEGAVLNGRYEIVRKIGGGGMGAVYLASDKNLGGILRAVKEMVQSYIEDSQQEKAVNDFKRESLLLTSLDHPAIPTIFDYFYDEKEGRFYLVMKYISGGDLAARLRAAPEGRIDEASVTEWAIQIADVLDYLHNRQPPIVYRDLKPSNIMIDGNTGRVMLIDFGIARWINKEEKGVTAVGTMGYAPPELFSGNVEPRSDIYSLGSTMFHLLTGADPQNNPLLIFDFHKHPRPRQINPQLTDQIEQILMRAVEYNADKRFSSAAEMRDILAKHLENLKTGKVTYGMGEKGGAVLLDLNQPVFCGFCGQKIVASDLFCPFCGAKQPLAEASAGASIPTAPSPAYVAPKLTARLYVINTGELDAPVFNLEKDNTLIGRRDPMSNIFPEVDLSKFDPQTKISRRHARIWREGDVFMVEDLGSSNGTLLVTKAHEPVRLLPQQPRPITHGDKLKLGDTTLHFLVG